jgi:hypothetical protein
MGSEGRSVERLRSRSTHECSQIEPLEGPCIAQVFHSPELDCLCSQGTHPERRFPSAARGSCGLFDDRGNRYQGGAARLAAPGSSEACAIAITLKRLLALADKKDDAAAILSVCGTSWKEVGWNSRFASVSSGLATAGRGDSTPSLWKPFNKWETELARSST